MVARSQVSFAAAHSCIVIPVPPALGRDPRPALGMHLDHTTTTTITTATTMKPQRKPPPPPPPPPQSQPPTSTALPCLAGLAGTDWEPIFVGEGAANLVFDIVHTRPQDKHALLRGNQPPSLHLQPRWTRAGHHPPPKSEMPVLIGP